MHKAAGVWYAERLPDSCFFMEISKEFYVLLQSDSKGIKLVIIDMIDRMEWDDGQNFIAGG
jgi:hypothetical protein